MKIGIFAYRQLPYISANTSIAYILGEELIKQGYSITHIGYMQDETQRAVTYYGEATIRFLNNKVKRTGKIENYGAKILGDKWRLRDEIAGLRQIVREEQIDMLLCVIAPADDLLITHYANLEVPVILYQLDPYYNHMDRENPVKKTEFINILKGIKHLFTTDLLYSEYSKDAQFSYLMDRITFVRFPKLIQINSHSKEPEEHIHLLYAGSFYHKIRSPEILIALKKNLPVNCEVIFCGSCDDAQDMDLLRGSGIICKGYCSQSDLLEEVDHADILVNIGNLVKNQLGSKIVDYIGTGKPIINIYQFESCPTIQVLEKYPYKINLHSSNLGSNTESNLLATFLQNVVGKKVPWSEIAELYVEYTPEYVANALIDAIEK